MVFAVHQGDMEAGRGFGGSRSGDGESGTRRGSEGTAKRRESSARRWRGRYEGISHLSVAIRSLDLPFRCFPKAPLVFGSPLCRHHLERRSGGMSTLKSGVTAGKTLKRLGSDAARVPPN